MKILYVFAAVFCGLLLTQCKGGQEDKKEMEKETSAFCQQAQGNECPKIEQSKDVLCECWRLYVHYEPCYYTVRRCVEVVVPYTKTCCRKVPKHYQVQRCGRCENVCTYEYEYYLVQDCKVCKRWVCERHCKYVPSYYWKQVYSKPECSCDCHALDKQKTA